MGSLSYIDITHDATQLLKWIDDSWRVKYITDTKPYLDASARALTFIPKIYEGPRGWELGDRVLPPDLREIYVRVAAVEKAVGIATKGDGAVSPIAAELDARLKQIEDHVAAGGSFVKADERPAVGHQVSKETKPKGG